MRYYKIVITDDDGNILKAWSSLTTLGTPDMGALMVEVDIQRYGMSTPKGMCLVRLHGIPIDMIRQANTNYYNRNIAVYLGMSTGLPLAKPEQSGLAISGKIFQPFGNWQGTNLSLDFIVTPGAGTNADPKNIVVQWMKGKSMSQALAFSLQRGFPDKTVTVNIDSRLVCNYDNLGFYNSLSQLAQTIKAMSKEIITDSSYSGVEITMRDGGISVYDGSVATTPIQLAFEDLIGQPTWIGYNSVSLKLVMRADIQVGDTIKMPVQNGISALANGLALVTEQSYSQYRTDASFTSNFMVTDVRMVGNSRSPDADGWVTVIEAVMI